MADLIRYTGDVLSDARDWASLSDEERRRRAFAACRDRDADDLWSLTLAFLTLYGKAGSHVSPHTKSAYKIGIEKLLTAWADQPLHKPSRNAAALYVRRMEASGLSASTIAVRLAGARTLYKALRWAGAVETDPLADARPAKDPTPPWEKRHPYQPAEIRALLDAAEHPSDTLLILLTARAGLRISEALALRSRDVSLSRREIVVEHGKGGKRRTVPIGKALVEALTTETLSDGDDAHILPFAYPTAARRRMRVLCRTAGVEYKGIHACRHTAGTAILRSGGTLQDAAMMLGHSSIETTRAYATWADDRLRTLIEDW